MALGQPVVAGSEGGPREIIEDDASGLLFLMATQTRWLRRFCVISMNLISRGEWRRRAQDFTAERYAERFVEVTEEVLSLEK